MGMSLGQAQTSGAVEHVHTEAGRDGASEDVAA
jgi:hypothetical protein